MIPLLTILNTAAIIVAAVFYFLKSHPVNPCAVKHDLAVINTQHTREGFVMTHTAVLHRCRNCGLHIVVHFPGEWTLEDFTMTEIDLRFLEGISK